MSSHKFYGFQYYWKLSSVGATSRCDLEIDSAESPQSMRQYILEMVLLFLCQ